MEVSSIPEGWPGNIWLEGKTIVHLQKSQERPSHMPRGPAKKTGGGFLNPAMAPARTRSVLLLKDALEYNWLAPKEKPIRAFDAMCSTGVRIRRWRNEIPIDLQDRLRITGNDLNDFAISWAKHSHNQNLPEYTENIEMNFDRYGSMSQREAVNGIFFQKMDAKLAMADASYQWIDIDPFGSPVPFIDSAIQSLARTGVLEVTATDTAALTGSSLSSQKRRYDSQGIVDDYAHDDAVRVLLGLIAKIAAMHDRVIKPIMSLFDGHHVRVSVLVKTSKEGASDFQENIGYRLRCDDLPYRFIKYPCPFAISNNQNRSRRGNNISWAWTISCLYLNGFSQSSNQTKRVHWKVSELNIQSTVNLLPRIGIEPRRDRHLLQASKDSKLWLKDNKKRKLSWSSN